MTEGGADIGFGHVARCSALAKEFKRQEELTKVNFIINADSRAENFLRFNHIEFINLDWLKYIDKNSSLIKDSQIIIIDSYIAPKSFYTKLYLENISSRIVVIDDYNRLDYAADIIINPSPYDTKQIGYKKKAQVTYLIGKEYIILREEFQKASKKKILPKIKDVLVAFGGKDYFEFMKGLISLLMQYEFNLHIVTPKPQMFNGFKDAKLNLYPNLHVGEMFRLMSKADLSISSGGQTIYELTRVGTPSIGICFAQNQVFNLRYVEKIGFIDYLGFYNRIGIFDSLRDSLLRLSSYRERLRRSRIGSNAIDGLGAQRVVNFLLKRPKAKIELAPVKISDSNDILSWRNHIKIRRWSFNPRRISLKTHRRWFLSRINNPKVRIFMAKQAKEKIGVIRFEQKKSQILVNINLNPEFLNLGFGQRIIKAGSKKIVKIFNSAWPIVAKIEKDNRRSQRAFKKAGYVRDKNYNLDKNNKAEVFIYRNS